MPPKSAVPVKQPPEPPPELPWYMSWLRREKSTMKGAPVSFFTCVALCAGLLACGIFSFDQWHYSGTIAEKDATITAKDATITSVSADRDSIKREYDRLAAENEHLRAYRGKDAPPLKQNALILAQQIHDYIKDWKDTDPPQITSPNIQKYVQRFGLRASLMRDDLDQNGQDSPEFDKAMYKFNGNYEDVKVIADSIQKLANKLPD